MEADQDMGGRGVGRIVASLTRLYEMRLTSKLNLIPLFLVSLLLGRTLIADSLSPFGPALFAALKLTGNRYSVSCAVLTLIGSISQSRGETLVFHIVSMALIALAQRRKVTSVTHGTLEFLLGGAMIAASRAVLVTLRRGGLFDYTSAVLEGLCATVFTAVAYSALCDPVKEPKDRRAQALAVLALLSIGGFRGIEVAGVNIGTVVAMALTLAAGFIGGPGPGAIAGLSGGLILALTTEQHPTVIGFLGVSGLFAGMGGWFGRLESVIGFVSAGLISSVYIAPGNPLGGWLPAQLIGCSVILLLTPDVTDRIRDALPLAVTQRKIDGSKKLPDMSRLKVAAVAHALLEIGKILDEASSTTTSRPTAEQKADASAATGARDRYLQESGHELLTRLAERVCHDCAQRSFCWEESFGETYHDFGDLISALELAGSVRDAHGQGGLCQRCIRFGELLRECNHQKEIERMEKRYASAIRDIRECLTMQYRCLGQLVLDSRPAGAVQGPGEKKSNLRLTFKGETLPAEHSSNAGDVWARFDLGGGRHFVVIADGMGKGEIAARHSREAIELLISLLNAGLDYDGCISFMNSALYLAWGPESFIAMDCVLIDEVTERAYFHKLGAPPSFIRKRDGTVLVVRGYHPPAGAVNQPPWLSSSEPIAPGDCIFLVSDGVFRSSLVPARAEHSIVSKLRRLKDSPLEVTIKALLSQGLRNPGQTLPDDVTVLGISVERA